MYNRDSLYGLQYEYLPDYLAISADQASHVPLQSQELATCRQFNSLRICPKMHTLQRTHTTPSSVVSLFKGEAILDACKQLLTPWKGIYSYHTQVKRLVLVYCNIALHHCIHSIDINLKYVFSVYFNIAL